MFESEASKETNTDLLPLPDPIAFLFFSILELVKAPLNFGLLPNDSTGEVSSPVILGICDFEFLIFN